FAAAESEDGARVAEVVGQRPAEAVADLHILDSHGAPIGEEHALTSAMTTCPKDQQHALVPGEAPDHARPALRVAAIERVVLVGAEGDAHGASVGLATSGA